MWKDLCAAHGVATVRSTPVLGPDGTAIASFFICFAEPREADPWDLRIAEFGAHIAAIAIERDRAATALRESQADIEAELTAARQLQAISGVLIRNGDIEDLYQQIVDAAAAIMRSDCASMQMFYPERGDGGELRLIAHRGFDAQFAATWQWVRTDSVCSCGMALRTGQRTVVPNVEDCDYMADGGSRPIYLQAGIHAMQSTPRVSRSGRLLGMISTHWRRPHHPAESDLRRMDVLARQAADVIEHKQAEDVWTRLDDSSEQQRSLYGTIMANTPDLVYVFDLDHRFTFANATGKSSRSFPPKSRSGARCLLPAQSAGAFTTTSSCP